MTIKTKLLTYLADIELTATTKSKLEADITSSICKNLREDAADLCESEEKFIAAVNELLDASTEAARFYATKDNAESEVAEFKTHSRVYAAILSGLQAFLNPPADIHAADRT